MKQGTMTKQVNLIERKSLRNGTTLYIFQSSRSTKRYFITLVNGVLNRETHTDCEGFKFNGKCCHTDEIARQEAAIIKPEEAEALAEWRFCRHCGFHKTPEQLAEQFHCDVTRIAQLIAA